MRRGLLVGLAGLAVFAAAAASAGGSRRLVGARSIGAPVGVVNVNRIPEPVDDAQLAVGANGTVAVAWDRFVGRTTAIRIALRSPGGDRFGSLQTVSPPAEESREPQIAIAPDGTVTAVWYSYPGRRIVVREATRRPGQARFGPSVVLSRAGTALSPRVAISPDGTTTVVWSWEGSGGFVGIQEVTRPSGSQRFTAPVTLLRGHFAPYPVPLVTAGLDGSTIVGWVRGGRLETTTRARGARSFKRPVRLATHARSFALAQGDDGTTATAWEAEGRHPRIGMAIRRQGAETFTAKTALSIPGVVGARRFPSRQPAHGRIRFAESGPVVAVSRDGTVTVAWLRPSLHGWVLDAAWRAPGAPRWTRRRAVEKKLDVNFPLAVAPSSHGVRIIWSALAGGIYETTIASGAINPHHRLSKPGSDVFEPHAASTHDDHITVIWTKAVKAARIEQATELP